MGRLLYGLGLRVMNFMVVFLIVILLPGLPPRTTFPFKEFSVAPPRPLTGALEPNYHLEGAERLLEGRVYGPECLIAKNRDIYMGIHGGEVIKINAGHVTHVTKLGQPCEDITEESRCGRPLGLAFDTQGNNLLVADAYYGIWQVDLDSHKKKLLVSPQQVLPGKGADRPAKLFNDVAVDKQGNIYWSDSSSDYLLQDLVYTSLVNPSGRVFKYDRVKNESTVLMDEVFFANGVALSPQEDFLVVAETGGMRLLKHYLKGSKAGQTEVFVEGLPGMPDNLTPDSEGLWVPLVMASDNEHPSGFNIFCSFPSIRLFLARMLTLFELPFKLINNAYPNKIAQRFIHFIGHGESILLLSPKRATVVRVDWNGHIVGSLHGFDKSVGAISHVLEFDDHLLFGSPFNRFLGRVANPKPARKEPNVKINNVRYEGVGIEPAVKPPQKEAPTTAKPKVKPTTTTTTTPKPTTTTTTTPKPTTTTPKPTTTTPKPTTTTPKPTTTTPKPTTTTTPKPTTTTTPKPATTTAPKPSTTTTPKPTTTSAPRQPSASTTRVPPKKPAPVEENIPHDTPAPKPEKMKVINKHGEHVEL
ncbi:adipocyte plasma membrane-associated protein Hemomucin [Musca domestica]|uniref:Adipocyte plasma membrane-associated protein Hemomucin n=1 Tax=Musca domestica TaxID=7370 RepID=T1PHE2_MUSDO|nr:adipocyte plasma membrane-associated protein Hemomucin [Musca domestica]XP_011291544.2 adipocyte plasma membrane-associated protein Hemomucin [Musca domestica]